MSGLPGPSRLLREALVGAYPGHVRARLGNQEIPGLEEALTVGSRWLSDTLGALLETPFEEQRRGPLEIFQEAMRFPTEHLSATGRAPEPRDPVAAAALPGDLYDLAPASTRDLGDEVWALHIAWGAAKAAAITSPREPPAGGP